MEQVDQLWSTYCYIRDYHPWRDGRNPAFDAWDGKLLDFKDRKAGSVDWAYDELSTHLDELELPSVRIPVVIVPGHTARDTNSGSSLANLATKLEEEQPQRFNARIDVLIRHTTVPKLAHGGSRQIEVHLNSIRVNGEDKIRGGTILLIDDVTTTGNSVSACRRILMGAGAKRVAAVVLGRTAA